MKNLIILFVLLIMTGKSWAACNSPISRTNLSSNSILTSTKYNGDLNTVYSKVNSLPGDCINDATISTAKIEDAAITADKIAPAVLGNYVPAGAVLPYAAATAPTGYLLCDGTAVSRTTYAALFAVIGTTHGSGNGSTTFNLPDYRGRFIRGVDGGVGRDPDRATRTAMASGGDIGDNVGSVQGDAFQGHWHSIRGEFNNSDAADFPSNTLQATDNGPGGSATGTLIGRQNIGDASTDGVNGTPQISSETRPENAYVQFIIKY